MALATLRGLRQAKRWTVLGITRHASLVAQEKTLDVAESDVFLRHADPQPCPQNYGTELDGPATEVRGTPTLKRTHVERRRTSETRRRDAFRHPTKHGKRARRWHEGICETAGKRGRRVGRTC
mmetsp:Transcript_2012/g.12869  ORF Transcript_2012/g.12869 Transcript_2012/m.12869 type:complete len:123 (-) Transcript_2012:4657-5025(-)